MEKDLAEHDNRIAALHESPFNYCRLISNETGANTDLSPSVVFSASLSSSPSASDAASILHQNIISRSEMVGSRREKTITIKLFAGHNKNVLKHRTNDFHARCAI